MKKLSILTLGLATLTLSTLWSCRSKRGEGPEPTPTPQKEYLQKKVVTELFKDQTQSFKTTSIYDASGKLIEEYRSDWEAGDKFVVDSRAYYAYSATGKLTKITHVDEATKKESGGISYEYDAKDQLQKEESYGIHQGKQEVYNYSVYTWVDGKKATQAFHSSSGGKTSLRYTIKYSYKDGYEYQDTYPLLVPNSYSERKAFRYDAQGRVIEMLDVLRSAIPDPNDGTKILRYEDATITKYVTTYNERDDIAKVVCTNQPTGGTETHVRTTEYTYLAPDKKGNPTKYQIKDTFDTNKDRIQTREVTIEYTYAK